MEWNVKNFRILLGIVAALFMVNPLAGQDKAAELDEEYLKVVTRRAEKIVLSLDLKDPEMALEVGDIIAMQYYHLSEIHDARDAELVSISNSRDLCPLVIEKEKKKIIASADKKIAKLHKNYLRDLSKYLSPSQVDGVKDGMTYGILGNTYEGYLALLPDLTQEQKEKIMDWLVEAREIAMDAGSSEEKHYWFGQYKGKINNYLSAEGYDLKKAEQERK